MSIFFPMTLFVELIVYHNEQSRTIRNASVRNPTAMFLPVYTGLRTHMNSSDTSLPCNPASGCSWDIFFFREPWDDNRDHERGSGHEIIGVNKKKMCNFEPVRFVLLILLFSITLSKADNIEKRKNVLVMIADDFGLQTQVYNNTVCKTPNLNALAKRSVTFKNAFTSVSSCSPSRSAILTGEKIRSASDVRVRKLCSACQKIRHECNRCFIAGTFLK